MARDNVSFGITAPQIHQSLPVDPDEIQIYIRRAEAFGFDGLWVLEPMGLRAPSLLESLSLLNYAAALTSTIRLGTAVLAIPLRSAVHLAKSLSTLDQLSRGRLIVGVGLGGDPGIFPAYGITAEHRLGRLLEGVSLLRRLWTEEQVTFHGRFARLDDAPVLPKPFQQPHPPLWFGGSAPAALKRAAELGTGFVCGGSTSTAQFKEQAEAVRRTLDDAGRDPAGFTVAKRVFIAVDENRERAHGQLRDWFASYYNKPQFAERAGIYGGPEECAERLAEVSAAGADMIILNPVADLLEQLHALAEGVVPLLEPDAELPRVEEPATVYAHP
jgi:probable F420-dependent oxidoreductase